MSSFTSYLTTFVVFILTSVLLLYLWFRKRYNYWKNKGVFSLEATFPCGNVQKMISGSSHIGEVFADVYFQTKHEPYAGIFMLHRASFIPNDLDFIKTILVKDFVHFSDHGFHYNEELEPLAGHLFNQSGEKWKNLRYKLTPAFTTSKIKQMFEIVGACGREMMDHLATTESDELSIDLKELLAKLNTDVIGNCAFGIECNSFKDANSEFRIMGRKIFEPPFLESILENLDFFIPGCTSRLKVLLFDNGLTKFFHNLVESTIHYREKNNIQRKDFLQLLIQLKNKGTLSEDDQGKPAVDDGTRLTTMQLAAQVFVFFIAGFETSSTTASFALYELACNPEVQDTLQQEIDEVLAKTNGEITYDSLGEMTYLTMCIEETLRKYPPLPMIFRICTKNYTIPGTDILIEKDTPVMIPILGIQRDPQFYPDPMKFDPERFTPENKASRHHFSYLPFGEGPRICIGSRFGMMQTRLGLVSILSKYKVSVCDKTNIPMKYDNKTFILTSDGGVWLKLTKRNK